MVSRTASTSPASTSCPRFAPSAAARQQRDDDAGYSTQQRTRPQTVGYALTDSPAGLAAWIGEKLDSWADPRTPVPEDRILDTLMVYWLPRAAASSARLYWESLGDVTRWIEGPLDAGDSVGAPAGCTVFPHELQRPVMRPQRASPTSAIGASPNGAATSRRSSSPRRSRPMSRPSSRSFASVVLTSNRMVIDSPESERADALFHALADPTRRDILATVLHDAHSVTELARRYPISFVAVHKHVGTLERAGLVTKTRHGREQRVRGDAATLRTVHRLLDDLETLWHGRIDRIAQILGDPTESEPQ